ncbi:MAG: ABC transporter substrate-binding protein [Xanthobacteraceae bacterium]
MRQSGAFRKSTLTAAVLFAAAIPAGIAQADGRKAYDTGASDTEIRIGHTTAYSGPASMLATNGRVLKAFVDMLNADGGINGRKIKLISYDDGYSPPKTLEQVRKLVESDEVLFVFGIPGSPTNAAVHKYLNGKKVPQIGITSGAERFNDPKNFPWTMPLYPSSDIEEKAYVDHILKQKPDPKIGILYQNDDYGKGHLKALEKVLGKHGKSIHHAASYETTEATVDSQIINIKNSGADVLINITTPKFAAMAMRKAHELGWKPLQYLGFAGSAAMGLLGADSDAASGVITASFAKAPNDPALAADPEVIAYREFMQKWDPQDNANDFYSVSGYITSWLLKHILERAGDDLTRENIMKVVGSIKNTRFPMHQPSIVIQTDPSNFDAYKTLELQKFNGKGWESTK